MILYLTCIDTHMALQKLTMTKVNVTSHCWRVKSGRQPILKLIFLVPHSDRYFFLSFEVSPEPTLLSHFAHHNFVLTLIILVLLAKSSQSTINNLDLCVVQSQKMTLQICKLGRFVSRFSVFFSAVFVSPRESHDRERNKSSLLEPDENLVFDEIRRRGEQIGPK